MEKTKIRDFHHLDLRNKAQIEKKEKRCYSHELDSLMIKCGDSERWWANQIKMEKMDG